MEKAALELMSQYGPWGGLLLMIVLHLNSRSRFNDKKESHKKEVETLKSEYQRKREDDQRRFQEFKDLYNQQREEAKERFEAVVSMYERNIDLVKAYESMAKDQMSLISLTAERLKETNEIARNNLICPLRRFDEKTTRTIERGDK